MRIQVGCMTLSWYETEYKEISLDSSSVKILGRDGEIRVVSFTPEISRKISSSNLESENQKQMKQPVAEKLSKEKSNNPNNSPSEITNSQIERKKQEDSFDLKFKQIEDKFLDLTSKLESIHLLETYNQVLGDIAEFKRKQENLQVKFMALYEKCGLSFIEDSKKFIELYHRVEDIEREFGLNFEKLNNKQPNSVSGLNTEILNKSDGMYQNREDELNGGKRKKGSKKS